MKNILLKRGVLFLMLTGILFIIGAKIKRDYPKKEQSGQIIEEDESCINNFDQIDIMDVPLDRLARDEYALCYEHDRKKVVFNGNRVSQILFSPTGENVGFMENRNYNDKNVPYDRQVLLYTGNVNKRDLKEIFHGSIGTSGWEWSSDNEVTVYYSCGTECQALYLIDVDSGEKNILAYGVAYEWSPNKELVMAYHYSWGYGITVGDKKGKELASVIRNNPSPYTKLTEKTKSVWSPDSLKLALIIKKEDRDQMEILVFDIRDNFKQIFRRDVDEADKYDLQWSEDSRTIRMNGTQIVI